MTTERIRTYNREYKRRQRQDAAFRERERQQQRSRQRGRTDAARERDRVYKRTYYQGVNNDGSEVTERIYAFIRQHVEACGYPPSLREISRAVKRAPSNVGRHLNILEAHGRIARADGRARAIRLVDPNPWNWQQYDPDWDDGEPEF